jgi:hypothetical protein
MRLLLSQRLQLVQHKLPIQKEVVLCSPLALVQQMLTNRMRICQHRQAQTRGQHHMRVNSVQRHVSCTLQHLP